jgi:hypothetical protein
MIWAIPGSMDAGAIQTFSVTIQRLDGKKAGNVDRASSGPRRHGACAWKGRPMTVPPRSLALLVLTAVAASSAACASPTDDEESGTSEQHMEQRACTPTDPVSYSGVDEEEAEYRSTFHTARGASVTKKRNADSTFEVVATYPPNQTIVSDLERISKNNVSDHYRDQGARVFVVENQSERFDVYVYLPCNK